MPKKQPRTFDPKKVQPFNEKPLAKKIAKMTEEDLRATILCLGAENHYAAERVAAATRFLLDHRIQDLDAIYACELFDALKSEERVAAS